MIEIPPFSVLSTSGTYGRSYNKDGRTYSHLFDPRTAEPMNIEASATVICRSAAESEAAAKAVLLLPRVDWLRLEIRNGRLVREHSSTLPARPAGAKLKPCPSAHWCP